MSTPELEITPDEIRAIREGLGLTQVQAGQLIGGGPRAFTKYESGIAKPSAALVRLLRVLDADPNAAAVLGLRRKPSSKPSPFRVTVAQIRALTERTLPELLERLLHAEAHVHGLAPLDVLVSSNIHAPDGGEDGCIQWRNGPNHTPFLPNRSCQFQSKAGETSPTQAGQDVLTSAGAVKDMVRSVLEDGGHYIMLCAHPYNRKQRAARETRIRESLRGTGLLVADNRIHFRGAEQIAGWVNRYPSVVAWVQETTQLGTTGPFNSWDHWDGRTEHSVKWVADDRLAGVRHLLQEKLAEPCGVARVVGPLGIGNSRLVLEAFRTAGMNETAGRAMRVMAMYAIESEAGSNTIVGVVQKLAGSGQRAIVVVDHCSPETHQILANAVSHRESRLSLLTIDHESVAGVPRDATLEIAGAASSVIESIIGHVAPDVTSMDRQRLARFCRGYPKIALLVARTWNTARSLAGATDDTLVDAFIVGRGRRDSNRLLGAAELLAVFGWVGAETATSGDLPGIAGYSRRFAAQDLYSAIGKLADRGVARRRGRLVTIQPPVIAIKLAERRWKDWDPDSWDEVLSDGSRLNVRAARQLALLNTTAIAPRVVEHVCRYDGPFAGVHGIFKPGRAEILAELTKIEREEVAHCIERSLGDVQDPSQLGSDAGRHLVRALKTIAFHVDTFEDAAHLLLRLATTESELCRDESGRFAKLIPMLNRGGLVWNAQSSFKELFPVRLGNTQANGDARLSFLRDAASACDPTSGAVVIEALAQGCKTRGFSRMIDTEIQGTRPTMEPWGPATWAEYRGYIEGCIALLVRFAVCGDAELGDNARSALGSRMASLVWDGFIDAVEKAVHQVVDADIEWPLALRSLRAVLVHRPDALSSDVADRVRALLPRLEPASLRSRVRSLVTEAPLPEAGDWEDRYECRLEEVRNLADELLRKPAAFDELLRQLSSGDHQMAWELGVAVGEHSQSGTEWLEPMVQTLIDVPESERNYALMSGYVSALAKDHPDVVSAFKSKAARSGDLAPALPLICARLGITRNDIRLAIQAISDGHLSPWRVSRWRVRGALDVLPATTVAPLLDMMLDLSAQAYEVAVELLGSLSHKASEKLEEFAPQIVKVARNATRWTLMEEERIRDSVMLRYHFELIVGWMLEKGREDPDARATALSLSKALAEGGDSTWVKPVLPLLFSNFPEIAWPLVGEAIVSDDSQATRLGYTIGEPISSVSDSIAAILTLPEDTLFAWFHAHPDRAPAFAARHLPVLSLQDEDHAEAALHPVMAQLLDEFGTRANVQEAVRMNVHTYSWTGSSADYYKPYEETFFTIANDPDRPAGLRRWAKRMVRELGQAISRETIRDQERGRSRRADVSCITRNASERRSSPKGGGTRKPLGQT